jgi:hypothetical protein
MPDSKHFVFVGREPGHGVRTYLQSSEGGPPKVLSPEGCAPRSVSSDGQLIVAECIGRTKWKVLDLTDGHLSEPKGLQPGDTVIGWAMQHHLWLMNSSIASAQLIRLDPVTGLRVPWKEISFDSFSGILTGVVTPDGNTFVHTDWANFGNLKRVYGFR